MRWGHNCTIGSSPLTPRVFPSQGEQSSHIQNSYDVNVIAAACGQDHAGAGCCAASCESGASVLAKNG